jgi:hypothetical protein
MSGETPASYLVTFPVSLEQFKVQISNRTSMFGRNRWHNGKAGARIALFLACLGAIGTISVGISGIKWPYTFLGLDVERVFNLIALIATATTTATQSWAAFAGHRLSYAFYSDGETRLWQIRRDLEHVEKMAEGDAKAAALISLYSQFQTLLADLNTRWQAQQSDETQPAAAK